MSNIGILPAEKALTEQVERLLCLKDLSLRKLGGAGRRWRNNASKLANDLGGNPSFAERQLAMRAALLAVLLEDQEVRVLSGQKISLADYTTMVSVQKQLLLALGLERRKDTESGLGALLRRGIEQQP
jgi:hypothetical protein